jgi:endodeoxyribonuclease RusA
VFVLDIVVNGRPRSKGSHVAQQTASGKLRAAAVQEDDLSRWERAIRSEASQELNAANRQDRTGAEGYPRAWRGPVLVMAHFRLTRPRRLADTMAAEPALVVPDLDKITRALLDGLNGVAYADDKQVTALLVTKGYASPLERPGVTARVVAIEDGDEFAGWTLARMIEGWA